ncbi:hypothetical protein NA57DRAFT_54516 [Rhizodiscina lignyota]|uniref:Uncharacterized protein n=1 Tax=Rhizodiscina lignyota TaxID=1504668 RepID=A0A9P4IL28_9PEZI|nr:hypothetical protein NA57DRAFT_54516 [Rhizodiscina lignyota]
MSSDYGSGTTGGVGFGNKTSADPENTGHEETRFGTHTNTDSYSSPTEYGSGTTSGAGFGNKTGDDGSGEYDNSDTRFGSHQNTAPYSGHREHGSGTTGGAGFGNKTGSFSQDSTIGKMMEKAGSIMNNEKMVEKGHAKREAAGFGQEDTS